MQWLARAADRLGQLAAVVRPFCRSQGYGHEGVLEIKDHALHHDLPFVLVPAAGWLLALLGGLLCCLVLLCWLLLLCGLLP